MGPPMHICEHSIQFEVQSPLEPVKAQKPYKLSAHMFTVCYDKVPTLVWCCLLMLSLNQCYGYCSEDNRNSAHCPDDANPKYYVQTQEGRLIMATSNVRIECKI